MTLNMAKRIFPLYKKLQNQISKQHCKMCTYNAFISFFRILLLKIFIKVNL